MDAIVLVHGGNTSTETWNRLTVGSQVFTEDGFLGAWYWNGTVEDLSTFNHQVFAPTLGDELTSTLTRHIGEVWTLMSEDNLYAVILIGLFLPPEIREL